MGKQSGKGPPSEDVTLTKKGPKKKRTFSTSWKKSAGMVRGGKTARRHGRSERWCCCVKVEKVGKLPGKDVQQEGTLVRKTVFFKKTEKEVQDLQDEGTRLENTSDGEQVTQAACSKATRTYRAAEEQQQQAYRQSSHIRGKRKMQLPPSALRVPEWKKKNQEEESPQDQLQRKERTRYHQQLRGQTGRASTWMRI